MTKLKQIFIILCILLLALVLAACTGDTPKPSDEGGETEQPGGDIPGTDDPAIPADGVFTITQDRFAAEKAALAMFDAVSGRMETGAVASSEDGNVNIEFTSDEERRRCSRCVCSYERNGFRYIFFEFEGVSFRTCR